MNPVRKNHFGAKPNYLPELVQSVSYTGYYWSMISLWFFRVFYLGLKREEVSHKAILLVKTQYYFSYACILFKDLNSAALNAVYHY